MRLRKKVQVFFETKEKGEKIWIINKVVAADGGGEGGGNPRRHVKIFPAQSRVSGDEMAN